MSDQVPDGYADLLRPEKRAFAHLALVLRDGSPHVTPMWFDYDGTHFIFNTARGRVKDRILHRHPAVAFDVPDPGDPYRYVFVRGRVVEESEAGAFEQICALNQKYHGNPNYPSRSGEVRVTYRVLPERISTRG